MQTFVQNEAPQWIEVGGGVRRKIRAYSEDMMLVEINFDEGAPLVPHSHPHKQISYVLDGEFQYHVDGVMHVMRKVHGGSCVKAGTLLDIFTPMREDFLQE